MRPFNFELSAQKRPHLRRDARARHLKSDIILRTLQQLTRSLRPPTSHTTPRLRRPAAPSPTASAWTSLSLSTSLRPHLCDQTVFFSAKLWRRPRQLNVHDPSSSRLHSRSTKDGLQEDLAAPSSSTSSSTATCFKTSELLEDHSRYLCYDGLLLRLLLLSGDTMLCALRFT